ncbi:MAG: maleylpyruvate isomerase N-terminal domain-containing protein [Actinobacteria bacterium]|nr:maleylpyruvate isomerase N-terminal domain-containing protein [Actinomycetota bacterium]
MMVGALEWDVYKDSMLMNIGDLDEVAEAFREASEAFEDLVARPEVGKAWDQPSALEGYSVGAIVAHVNAAIGWLGRLMDAPAQPNLRPTPPAEYLGFLHGLKIDPEGADRHPIHDVLHEQFEQAATRGWEPNRDKFLGLVERLTERLEGESATRLLDLRPTVPLVVGLGDFLRSRVIELVVHGDDLATSVGIDDPPRPERAAAVTIGMLLTVARTVHGDLAVVRALSRRERASATVFPVF